jgi:hypothetical protein
MHAVLQERQGREAEPDRDPDRDAHDLASRHVSSAVRRTSAAVRTSSTTVGR